MSLAMLDTSLGNAEYLISGAVASMPLFYASFVYAKKWAAEAAVIVAATRDDLNAITM